MTKTTLSRISLIPSDNGVVIHRYLESRSGIYSRLGIEIIDGFVAHTHVDSYYSIPRRRFDFYSLSLMREGHGLMKLGNGPEEELFPGDLILVTPGCENRYGGAFGQVFNEETLLFGGETIDRMAKAGIIKSGKYSSFPSGTLESIVALANTSIEAKKVQACFRLLDFLGKLYDKTLRHHTDAIDEILLEIQRQPTIWWTVKELAEMANMKPNHFRQVFVQRTGVFPKHYIEEIKMRAAARQLVQNPDANLEEIADHCGYQDKYHFARRFKAFYKISPGHYRRQIVTSATQQLP